jgi:outer membrane protein assembly factor BamB
MTRASWLFVGLVLASPVASGDGAKPARDWPQFRGIAAAGVGEGRPLPSTWDASSSKGVTWKTPIPGLGHSSPVVWNDLVCVTTAISGKADVELKVGLYGDIKPVQDDTIHSWKIFCLDKRSGKVRWEQTAATGVPKIKRHTKATHASSTLATDGRFLVAMFGSEGLYCYDMKGRLAWKKDLGTLDSGFFMVPQAQWGFGSSPVIHDGRVILQADVQGGGFLASYDLAGGKEVWRTPRADVPTWSTPTVHVGTGRAQVIVNGWKHIGGYDLRTGKEIWRLRGGGDIPVPTPVVSGDLVYVTNAHGSAAPVYAIRTTATGDITLAEGQTTSEHIAWSQMRDGAYMQTPLVYGDLLYVCRDSGVLSVYRAKTGERLYQQRLSDGRTGFTASAVAGDGKVYYTSEEGDIYVLKAGPTFELLSKNAMGEVCMATPAISDGALYFRTRGHVVAVGGA